MKKFLTKNIIVLFSVVIVFLGTFPISVSSVSADTINPSENKFLIKFKDENKKKNTLSNFKNKEQYWNKKWSQVEINRLSDLQKIASDPNVEFIEKDHKRTVSVLPDDPYFSSTGSYQVGLADQWNLTKINLKAEGTPPPYTSGWEISTGSTNTKVAVIDTGIDLTHPDLASNIDTTDEYNFVDLNTNVQDTDGHGTHVSGTIAAVTNNTTGIAGICWTCKIIPLKVVNSQGFAYDSDIASAINYAITKGAKVINISLGGPGYSQNLQDAVNNAASSGVLIVAAAGNDQADAGDNYPAAFQNVISVGATTSTDTIASFSNTGNRVDVTAPGVNILSTRIQTAANDCVGAAPYKCLSGTSMSSPHVTGVAGLLFDLHRSDVPPWNAKDVRYALLKSAHDLGTAGYDTTFGYGRLDALASLQSTKMAADSTAPTVSFPVSYNPGILHGTTATLQGSVNDTNLYIYHVDIYDNTSGQIVKQVFGRTNVSNNTVATFNTTQLPDGAYYCKIVAEDFAGNSSTTSSVNFTIDNTAPTAFTLNQPAAAQWINTQLPTFSWNSSTDSSTPITYDVYVDGSSITTGLTTLTYTTVTNLSEGSHTWYVKAKDSVGNSRNSSTQTFGVDVSPPSTFSINTLVNFGDVTFTFSTTDTYSGINKYQASIDSAAYADVTSPFTISTTDGTHSISIKAIDNVGNIQTISSNFQVSASRNSYLKSKGDFNFDGIVDLSDLSILASNWQTTNTVADANIDGVVDLSDLSIVASNWQKTF